MSHCDPFLVFVRLSVQPFTHVNNFSSETPGLHVEPSVEGSEKIINGHGPLIKMATVTEFWYIASSPSGVCVWGGGRMGVVL